MDHVALKISSPSSNNYWHLLCARYWISTYPHDHLFSYNCHWRSAYVCNWPHVHVASLQRWDLNPGLPDVKAAVFAPISAQGWGVGLISQKEAQCADFMISPSYWPRVLQIPLLGSELALWSRESWAFLLGSEDHLEDSLLEEFAGEML